MERNYKKPFRTIRRFTLKDLNSFNQHSAMSCSGLFTGVTNSFKFNGCQLCEPFAEIGVMDVLQNADYEFLDKISFFFGVFVDKLCELHESALITKCLKNMWTS